MALRKNKKANLRRSYSLFVEIGMVAALLLLILAFRMDLQPQRTLDFTPMDTEFIPMEDIQPTEIVPKPPPPPRPQVVVAVPDDTILPDDELNLDDPLDIGEMLTAGPPPEPDPEPEKEEDEPPFFLFPQEMPELIGKLNITYPEMARKAGIEGRVTVQFIVNELGSVTEAQVLRGIGGGCDEEALRIVREAKFKPGKQRGKAVKVKMSLPITFRLK